MHYLNEQHIFIFLLQFFLLLGGCRLLGLLFQRIRQPTITADIIVGIMLGPTLLGRLLPSIHRYLFPPDAVQQTMLETLAWTGILFLLLETGLEVNFSNVWKHRKRAIKLSLSDLVLPIIITGVPIFFLPAPMTEYHGSRLLFTVFLATIMTISAMPVAIRAMHDLHILKTDMGFLIVSALSINDIVGWIVFTVLLGIFTRSGFKPVHVISVVFATLGFTFFCLTVLRRLSDTVISWIKERFPEKLGLSITFISLTGLACGAVTQRIGIHSLFGFFIAGLVVGEAKELTEQDRNVFSKLVYAIFIPLFFANIGLKIDFIESFDLLLVCFITAVGMAGRFIAAWVGATWAKRPLSNRVPIAIAHTPGGEMHLVVGMLALEYGLITKRVFVSVVCGAVASSIFLGPWLSLAIRRRIRVDITRLLSEKSIIPELKAEDRRGVLEALCKTASEISGVSLDMVEQAVYAREDLMSTAVENGTAFPHGRIEGLRRPYVLFGRSTAGVEWNSPDGMKTRTIFLVLTPQGDDDIQVHILRALSSVMSDKKTVSELLSASTAVRMTEIFEEKTKQLTL